MKGLTSSGVSVYHVPEIQRREQERVLAWARDARTNALRYILELTAAENGSACGCTCINCGHSLQAVNAGKSSFKVRPHFRHNPGAETARCQTLSARAALLASLQEGDWIMLPRMRRRAIVNGLSGCPYEGWVEVEPQRVRVDRLCFLDNTTAEITLADGRRVLVSVTGSAEIGDDVVGPCLVPRIEITTDDPELASFAADKLRAMLVPAIMGGSWCGHWPDPDLDEAAHASAIEAATDALDWDDAVSDHELEMAADMRRESLLHKEVKTILASAQSVLLPAWRIAACGRVNQAKHMVTESGSTTRVHLAGARLEKKLGRIIPDVIATLTDGSELLVEVTVTNTITPERLERIQSVDLPTIEIDFSRMAGMLRRQRLRALVLDEVTGKIWLHHPDLAKMPLLPPIDDFLLYGESAHKHAEQRRRWMMDTSAEEWGVRYARAVTELARLDHVTERGSLWDWQSARKDAYDAVMSAADALSLHGFPDALDYALYDDGHTVLHRLLSIQTGSPVGYKYGKVWQVINTMLTDVGNESCIWHGLYLIALQAYPPVLKLEQLARVDEWRMRVRTSLLAREVKYLRDGRYDALFGLIFPEMRPALAKPAARLPQPESAPHRIRRDDRSLDPGAFGIDSATRWYWAMSHDDRMRNLERAASQARIEGWSVGDTSILHHLVHARFGASVQTVVEHVAVAAGVGDIEVGRYLYREGYIVLEARTGSLAN